MMKMIYRIVSIFLRIFARSPRIPVELEGIRCPMLLDTGAEVSTAFMQYLFPGKELPETGREVCSLAGACTSLRGPLPLTIQICGVYFCENVKTFLLGYDVVSAAALVIDTDARCVY